MRTSLRRALSLALLTCAPLAHAQPHFATCASPTGTNASIVLPSSAVLTVAATPFSVEYAEEGDELAVFTPTGTCAGTGRWTKHGTVLAAWGDDPQTRRRDGLAPGDSLIYALWDASAGREMVAHAVAYDDLFDTSGLFAPDAVTFVTALSFVPADPALAFANAAATNVGNDPDGTVFAFEPNFPNPFAERTTLRFSIPEPTHVRLEVYDLLGRRVATLVDEDRAPGRYDVAFDAGELAEGTYVARLIAGSYQATQRLALVR